MGARGSKSWSKESQGLSKGSELVVLANFDRNYYDTPFVDSLKSLYADEEHPYPDAIHMVTRNETEFGFLWGQGYGRCSLRITLHVYLQSIGCLVILVDENGLEDMQDYITDQINTISEKKRDAKLMIVVVKDKEETKKVEEVVKEVGLGEEENQEGDEKSEEKKKVEGIVNEVGLGEEGHQEEDEKNEEKKKSEGMVKGEDKDRGEQEEEKEEVGMSKEKRGKNLDADEHVKEEMIKEEKGVEGNVQYRETSKSKEERQKKMRENARQLMEGLTNECEILTYLDTPEPTMEMVLDTVAACMKERHEKRMSAKTKEAENKKLSGTAILPRVKKLLKSCGNRVLA